MKVLFRVDANTAIGGGHFQRCRILAKNFAARGAEIAFASYQLDPIFERTLAENWAFYSLASQESLPEANCDICVLDHYELGKAWEIAMQKRGAKIFVLDDLGREHQCDLLWDPGYYSDKAARYQSTKAKQKLLGPDYAILGEEYVKARVGLRRELQDPAELVVMFGALDPYRYSLPYARAAAEHWEGKIALVVSQHHPDFSAILALAQSHLKLRILSDLPTLAPVFAKADLYLGAGGSTTWERLCLGLPSLVVGIASNQEAPAEALAAAGLQLYLGRANDVSAELAVAAANDLKKDAFRWQHLSQAGLKLVDGLGAQRFPLD